MLKRVTIACSFLLLLTSGAKAQMGMRQMQMPRGIFNPKVGSGAVYNMTTPDGKTVTMEIDVIAKDSVNGKDGYWFETVMTGGPAAQMGTMVMKMFTVLDGSDSYTAKMIMQMGDRPPMEMPDQMVQRTQQKQAADIRSSADDLGKESVTVPAGTFETEHYRLKDGSGDVWVSMDVAPYGAVKFTGKGTTMELAKVVTDAKDRITGTPQQFNPQALMGQRPQQ
jgi:hypothetical protein